MTHNYRSPVTFSAEVASSWNPGKIPCVYTHLALMFFTTGIAGVLTGAPWSSTFAAEPEDAMNRCAVIKSSVADAGFDDEVVVHCDDEHAYITSDSYPDHELMTGIKATNEQIPVPAIKHSAPVALNPRLTSEPKTRDSSLAIAVNGVPIFDYSSGGEMSIDDLSRHQPHKDTIGNGELDNCGGHAGRGDDYHYHELPVCMIDQMENAGDDAIIAWAFDGFPVYGNNNPDSSIIAEGDLDICNGQLDPVFGYRYHTSTGSPYIIQCIMGEVADFGALPRIPPLRLAGGGMGRPPVRPPRGGVDDLVMVEDENGVRTMTYSYKGEPYFINYKPSDTDNCYDFESKTVTNGGVVERGKYCR